MSSSKPPASPCSRASPSTPRTSARPPHRPRAGPACRTPQRSHRCRRPPPLQRPRYPRHLHRRPMDRKLLNFKAWAEAGGTSSPSATPPPQSPATKQASAKPRLLPDVLEKLGAPRAAIIRDWLAKTTTPDPTHRPYTPPTKLDYSWSVADSESSTPTSSAPRRSARLLSPTRTPRRPRR